MTFWGVPVGAEVVHLVAVVAMWSAWAGMAYFTRPTGEVPLLAPLTDGEMLSQLREWADRITDGDGDVVCRCGTCTSRSAYTKGSISASLANALGPLDAPPNAAGVLARIVVTLRRDLDNARLAHDRALVFFAYRSWGHAAVAWLAALVVWTATII